MHNSGFADAVSFTYLMFMESVLAMLQEYKELNYFL